MSTYQKGSNFWVEDREFRDADLTVQVFRSAGKAPLKFSIRLGTVREDQTYTPNIVYHQEESLVDVVFKRDNGWSLAQLLVQAQDYIRKELEWSHNQWLENKIQREQKSLTSGPSVRSTGKTARKKAQRAAKTE